MGTDGPLARAINVGRQPKERGTISVGQRGEEGLVVLYLKGGGDRSTRQGTLTTSSLEETQARLKHIPQYTVHCFL